jgi:hypothetical protein
MERHRHREIEDLVHQGIEELAQNGGLLPSGDPAIEDIRGHPEEEKAEPQGNTLIQDGPHQRPQGQGPRRRQKVSPTHKANVTQHKWKIEFGLVIIWGLKFTNPR